MQRLNDVSLSDTERRSAVDDLERLSIPKDLAIFEEMLKPEQPNFIRVSSASTICRLWPLEKIPASVRALVDDPAIGDSIKQFLADAGAAIETRRMRREEEVGIQYGDQDLISNFAKLFEHGLHVNFRAWAAEGLARSGERGITLLKLALTMSDLTARGCAAKALLETGLGDQKEQDAFLAALVMGLGAADNPVSNYLLLGENLHTKAMPLLKLRVLEKGLGAYHNDFAAILSPTWRPRTMCHSSFPSWTLRFLKSSAPRRFTPFIDCYLPPKCRKA